MLSALPAPGAVNREMEELVSLPERVCCHVSRCLFCIDLRFCFGGLFDSGRPTSPGHFRHGQRRNRFQRPRRGNSALGATPGTTDPTTGTYDFSGTTSGGYILTQNAAYGVADAPFGPTAAYAGTKFTQINKGTYESAYLGNVFQGGTVNLATTDLHAEFELYMHEAEYNDCDIFFRDSVRG